MTRIEKTFAALKAQQKKALITFIMAGDPTVSAAQDILNALPAAGADLIEIGMPFTDPMADGPAIQAAGLRALKNGVGLKLVLNMVQQFRTKNTETPVILMGYFNPVLAYGCRKFVQDAAKSGVDGLIIVDLPPEESDELAPQAQEAGLDFIRLITPTTDDTRLKTILRDASGFLYYVSITGVTGTKSADVTAVGKHIAQVKKQTSLPVVAGFGIKTPDDAQSMAAIADGIVVGSTIVQNIEQNQNVPDLTNRISAQISALKKAAA